MHLLNVILRLQQDNVSGTQCCTVSECPLCLEVDCCNLDMIMVDFEVVVFKELNNSFRK